MMIIFFTTILYNTFVAKAKKKRNSLPVHALPIILSVLLLVLLVITYQVTLADKYYPLTFVGNTNISFLTEGQAIRKVDSIFQKRLTQKLQFGFAQGVFTVDLATSSAALDYSALDQNFKDSHKDFITFFTQSSKPPCPPFCPFS